MPQVRKITRDDLEDMGVYLSVLDSGVVLFKSEQGNQIVTRINPTEAFTLPSQGGRAQHKKERDKEVKALLEELEIPSDNPRAKFMMMQALSAKHSGDAIRAFKSLVEDFLPDKTAPVPIQRIFMSDKAVQEYIASQIQSEYMPSKWMMDQNLKDDNWEDLLPHDTLQDEDLQVSGEDVYISSLSSRQSLKTTAGKSDNGVPRT